MDTLGSKLSRINSSKIIKISSAGIRGLHVDIPRVRSTQENRKLLAYAEEQSWKNLSHHLEQIFLIAQRVDDAQQGLVLRLG
jgi:hypothetical protein